MHAILVSVGTDGDVFPYIGVGEKLRSRGHRVTLAASGQYQDLASAHDLAFRALISEEEMRELLENPDFWHPIKAARIASRWGVRFLRRQYDLLAELAAEEDTLLLANCGVFAASLVHEKRGTPLANLVLQPGMIPSSEAPPVMPGLPSLAGMPRPLLKLFWRGMDAVGDLLVGRHVNQLRRALGLKPLRQIFQNWLSPQLAIGMFPEWFGPPQSDWPPQIRLTGFPMFEDRQQTGLPAEVLAFCRTGAPPIVFTFGTGMMHAGDVFRHGIEACERIGTRAIFLTKYRHQLPAQLPAFALPHHFVPFQHLFPHCAAVVHHGGIGTTARALAAGIPQLILPFAFDQMDNAARVKRLGTGHWLKSKHVNSARIAERLTQLISPEIQRCCRLIAERFEKKDACDTAGDLVEELFGAPRLVRPQH